jgi:hypothetical protein
MHTLTLSLTHLLARVRTHSLTRLLPLPSSPLKATLSAELDALRDTQDLLAGVTAEASALRTQLERAEALASQVCTHATLRRVSCFDCEHTHTHTHTHTRARAHTHTHTRHHHHHGSTATSFTTTNVVATYNTTTTMIVCGFAINSPMMLTLTWAH